MSDVSFTPRRIESEVQLLVEGNDLVGFCEGLITHLRLENLQVQNFLGVTQLRTFLPLLTKMSGFARVTCVGIVRDAERHAAGAFESVQGCLERAGLPVPETTGQCFGDSPAIGVMILPGEGRDGMLETLLCDTFRDAATWTCIENFFQCVEELQDEPLHRPEKARARAYLATKRDPHLSIGVAAKRGYWDLDHPSLQPLCAFLQELAVAGR